MDPDFPEFVWTWLGNQNLTMPAIHKKFSRWLAQSWHGNDRQLLLLALRNSGKSTLVGLFCAWRLMQDPTTRILVLAADYGLAKKMVRNVKRVIERHPLTQDLKTLPPRPVGGRSIYGEPTRRTARPLHARQGNQRKYHRFSCRHRHL